MERHFKRAIDKDPILLQLYAKPEFQKSKKVIESVLHRYYTLGMVEAFHATKFVFSERDISNQINPKIVEIRSRLGPIPDYYKYCILVTQLLLDFDKYVVELALKKLK